MISKKYLAEKHNGMRIELSNMKRQKVRTKTWVLVELHKHMEIMGERFYSGDIKVVDEFLQLYCCDEKRPKLKEKL
jgi:ATP-dependent phosphoenolpyruvate carboxykinase